jgi:hypothetical protein
MVKLPPDLIVYLLDAYAACIAIENTVSSSTTGVTAEMGRGMRAFRNMKTQMASDIEMSNMAILYFDPQLL